MLARVGARLADEPAELGDLAEREVRVAKRDDVDGAALVPRRRRRFGRRRRAAVERAPRRDELLARERDRLDAGGLPRDRDAAAAAVV